MSYTLTNPLCELGDVKAALHLDQSDTTDDDRIALAIDAASRQIESALNRRFYPDTEVSSRDFVAETGWLCEVDDFYTTVGLIVASDYAGDGTFSTIWDAEDYQLEPLNGIQNAQTGWPYTKIRAIRARYFPVWGLLAYTEKNTQALVRVTAQWGWAAIPPGIVKAAVVQSIFNFKADDAPFGATPFGEAGILRLKSDLHPTAAALIADYGDDDVMVG